MLGFQTGAKTKSEPGFDDLFAVARHNAIGFLRFVLAALVVFSHAFTLGGFGLQPLLNTSHETLGILAVNCFFILSGFLVARSFVTCGSTARYLWHRFLRILPAYWLCLLVMVFGFGVLLYYSRHHTLSGYFGSIVHPPLEYIFNNWLLRINQTALDSLLTDAPFPRYIDGALWTLEHEFRCYLAVAALGALGLLTKRRRIGGVVCLVVFASLLTAANAPALLAPLHLSATTNDTLHLGLWFSTGVLFWLFGSLIPVRVGLFIFAAVATVIALLCARQTLIGPFTLSYVTFYLALKLPMRHWDRRGDFSYGLYIYAFPVQQTLTWFRLNSAGLVFYFAASMVIATLLAMASWFLVERPALRFKDMRFGVRSQR